MKFIVDLKVGQDYFKRLKSRAINLLSPDISRLDLKIQFGHVN